jgi:RNA polymerase sigma factor (sigma-70 family)
LQRPATEKEFEEKIREHELLIHKVCSMYAYSEADRQDLFQDVVIQHWQSYSKYRGDAKFSTWLYRVAINTAITGLRKKKDFITSTEPFSLPHKADDESSKEEEDRLREMYEAIAKLNDIEKAVVMLYMEERTYEEMEEILGISESTLRVKMNRIREKLRQLTKKV